MESPVNMMEPEVGQRSSLPGTTSDSQASETKPEETTIGPQIPKANSERSIFDIEFSKLGALEPITKAVTIAAVVGYAAGFLIVFVNEGRMGFLDASLFKPRAMIVGIVALLLIVLPISLTGGVFIQPRADEKESGSEALARISLSLINFLASCGASWFVASFVFINSGSDSFLAAHHGSVAFQMLQFAGWMTSIVLIGGNGVLSYPRDIRRYWKAPRLWIGYSILWLILFAFAIWTLWRTAPAVYFAWCFLTSIFFHGYARDWRRGVIPSFKLPAVLIWSLSLLSLYGTFLFPKIKSSWGGGAPIQALLTLAGPSGSAPSEELRVSLIEATDSGYYFKLDGQENVEYIPKSSVQTIEFTTQTGR